MSLGLLSASHCLLLLAATLPSSCVAISYSGSGSGRQPSDGELQLVGGQDEREGRVEMFYKGEWGTVCGDLWKDSQTVIVCKQLNFYEEGQMVLTVTNNPEFFTGQSTGPIHMDRVLCTGDEQMLVNCTYSTSHTCTHAKDVGVVCPGNCTYGNVRLVGGEDKFGGRVEVCSGGLWGTVCDDNWDINEAGVVCRQLNIDSARPLGVGGEYFSAGRDPILLADLECDGAEQNLTKCYHSANLNSHCQHSEDAGVLCHGGTEDCVNNEIRLVDGWVERVGVVEVCYNGVWGAICDDSEVPEEYDSFGFYWRIDSQAAVICRQLGLLEPNTSALILRGKFFDFGPRPILLHHEEMTCSGHEDMLHECAGYVIGAHSCSETNGLYVQCPENCTHGDVRLIGGRNSKEGTVQVCVVGHWVIMCHDRWTHREAEVVCRQLNYLSPNSILVALTGHSFGYEGEYAVVNAVCSSNEADLNECHTELTYCESEDHAGVICEVNCQDEGTLMILSENKKDTICTSSPSSHPSPDAHHDTALLVSIIVPLLLIIAILSVTLVIFIMLLRRKTKDSEQVLQRYLYVDSFPNSNRTSKTDLKFDIPNRIPSPTTPLSDQNQQELPRVDLKRPQASLPHFYESLRGQHAWLSSPSDGGSLEILGEERGAAAANCNDAALNSVGNKHMYAILEDTEAGCNFAGPEDKTDSLPSLLAPSSPDHGDSVDESAVSSAAAVLNFETGPQASLPKLEPFSPAKAATPTEKVEQPFKVGFPQESTVSVLGKSTYDKLNPKTDASVSKTLEKVSSAGSPMHGHFGYSIAETFPQEKQKQT